MQIGNDITKIEALQVKNYYDYYHYGACQLTKEPNPTSINTKANQIRSFIFQVHYIELQTHTIFSSPFPIGHHWKTTYKVQHLYSPVREPVSSTPNSFSVCELLCYLLIPIMETKTSENKIDDTVDKKEDLSKDIDYKIDDVPPGTVSYPYLISPHLCISNDDPTRGYLISTTLFVSGIGTFLQTTVGTRLPIVQGSSMAFLVPVLIILPLPE
ncbi:hypothetical protein CEXT_789272 [Caerostris extrusa]|uniref:Uncharacterized protein n=1 Tax=Caerostris extrusa TaxID=172846 RepID=A0AAV4NJW1_CAEEX|nr:hypothetical protein CEXT_789272 [Caerostris extrusa]